MLFVWRGTGLAVPILFFITGWIVSFWVEDTRLGNPGFIGWTSMYAGIVLFLFGLAVMGGNEEENNSQEKTIKKKHDFFFIPIILWGLILGGLSIYLLALV